MDLGMSQKALALTVGMSQPHLSELENDLHASTTFAPKLAEALKVSAIWLSEGRHPPAPDASRQTAQFVRMIVEVIARECGVTLAELLDNSPTALDRLQARIEERHRHLK